MRSLHEAVPRVAEQLTAMRRPDLVDRLVLIGQYYNSSGKVTGGLVDQLLKAGDRAMDFMRAEYDAASPDGPEHFPVTYAKTMQMLTTEPEIELASLGWSARARSCSREIATM